MKIAILLPIYNRIEVTKQGLLSLVSNLNYYKEHSDNLYSYDIVIIDDGSNDGSSDWIKKNYPEIYLLVGDGSLWWSGAINIGAEFAISSLNSHFLLLWNDDTYATVDYFVNLEKVIDENQTNIIGSSIRDVHTNKTWSQLNLFNKYTGVSRSKGRRNKVLDNEWLTGMGTIVPVPVIQKLGFWDSKNFPQYFGDADFTLRASRSGYELFCSDKLIIYNRTEYSSYVGKDIKSFIKSLKKNNLGSRYNIVKRFIFYKKNCVSYFWLVTYVLYYLKYVFITFVLKPHRDKNNN